MWWCCSRSGRLSRTSTDSGARSISVPNKGGARSCCSPKGREGRRCWRKGGKRCATGAGQLERIGRGRRAFRQELLTFRRQPDDAYLAERAQRFEGLSIERNRQRP